MNINFIPSLQHLTLAKISIALCNNSEIKTLLKENRNLDPCKSRDTRVAWSWASCVEKNALPVGNYWSVLERSRNPKYTTNEYSVPHHYVSDDILKQIQDMVRGMISPLKLGIPLEKRILHFIPHIVLEIEKWEEDHSKALPAEYDAQVHFCWKSIGIIDRESTAENLLKRGNFPVKNHFFLACLFCIQNYLPELWDSLYNSYKSHLISECRSGSILNYWTACLDGFPSRRSAFPDASYITNVSALRYFYNQCGNEDKKRAFLNDVLNKQWDNLDLVRFCVPKLCQNGHEELSSLQCLYILRCFLNWPLQSYFLDVAEHLLVKLDLSEINGLLQDILRISITHHYDDIDYLNILKEIWKQIPSCHKGSLMSTPDFQPIKEALEQTSSKLFTP